jgi:hypothetical protein
MGIFTKDIKSMEDLFLHGLHNIYYAEQQITKALPKMIDMATNRDLPRRAAQSSGGDWQTDRASGSGLRQAGADAERYKLPGHRWHS